MTNIFENCSTHYSFEKNLQKCVNASNPCQLLQKMNTAHSLMIWMGFYIPSAMCFLAVLVDTYCLLVTISILKSLKKQSRKQYIFVVVRLSAAILIALCIIIIQSTYFIDIPFRDTFAFFAVLFIIYDFSILSLLGSFTGVAMMTYFGVMRPLVYRDKFTLKTIYIIAFAIVLFSVCVAIPFGLFQAADEIDGPIKCDSESCELIVKWLLFCIACLILMGCTGTLLFVTVSLHWHSYKSKKMGNVSSSAFNHGKSRLTWTTTILVILCCVELIPTGLLAAFGKSESISDDCYDFYNANSLIFPAIVSSLETFLGSITFLLDPIINFSFDKRISKVFSSQMKFLRSKVFCASSSSLSRNDKIIKDQSQIE
ncbi:Putative G-protein coupled receptor B0244.10 [Caenorhabditis elegans]|nr:Putative G-protein coupled receptor B0244.10 [Caenorhabditis elegans]CCD61507.2 Putative G-protein coupled receptor B0244.10 [Caenorhabditis elegans]|eukprot:NP_498240.3 Putative G-protein coupled receptor B0244.10 [Caenorhabditis elegans]